MDGCQVVQKLPQIGEGKKEFCGQTLLFSPLHMLLKETMSRVFHVPRRRENCTVLVLRMAHRKWKEFKQQPSMLPGSAVPGSCLVSSHFLWAILSTGTVVPLYSDTNS